MRTLKLLIIAVMLIPIFKVADAQAADQPITVNHSTIWAAVGVSGNLVVTDLPGGDYQGGVQWSWDGLPASVTVEQKGGPTPSNVYFYLTPGVGTAVGGYYLNLHGHSSTQQWSARVVLRVLRCRETFRAGTFTLKMPKNAAHTYFSFGGPDGNQAGVGTQFTFCAGSTGRHLTITLISSSDQSSNGFLSAPQAVSFYRLAYYPLTTLSRTTLNFTNTNTPSSMIPGQSGRVYTFTVQPGAYAVFFDSGWAEKADPSLTVTFSMTLS
jgi:hypothetical protein